MSINFPESDNIGSPAFDEKPPVGKHGLYVVEDCSLPEKVRQTKRRRPRTYR